MSNKFDSVKDNNYLDILKDIAPFSCLDEMTLEKIAINIDKAKFTEDSYIFRQGEVSKKTIFIIISGVAEITVKNENDLISVLDYRRTGSFCGETVVLSNKTYPASVKCLTEIECLLIDDKSIEYLLKNNGVFATQFNIFIADHFHSLISKISSEQGLAKGLMTYENQASQKRASELMNHPVITCSSEESINQIAEEMGNNQVSSIVLVNSKNNVIGLITEKDLVTNVITKDGIVNNRTVKNIANLKPITVNSESFYYQVLFEMIRNQSKHVIVTEKNKPIGIITISDLIRSRNSGIISVIDRLEEQTNLDDLALVAQEIELVLRGLLIENAPIPEILDIITEFYDRLTRIIIDLSLNEMQTDYGPPPVKFCWLTMGSSGRKEQFLRTDQDNALIYEKVSDKAQSKKNDLFFAKLASLINNGLFICGFALCPGNVMASNPLWNGDEEYWRSQISKWINKPQKNNIRLLTIFLDFRPVYGYYPLAEELRSFTNDCFTSFPLALKFLAEDACSGKLPINFLGNPVGIHSKKHKNELDLKKSVSVYLVDCIRLLAIKRKCDHTSTIERMQFLKKSKSLSDELFYLLESAFQTVVKFRIHLFFENSTKNDRNINYLNLSTLNPQEKIELKNSLKAIESLVAIIKEDYINN